MIVSLYRILERRTPAWIKRLLPERWRIQLGYRIKTRRTPKVPILDLRHNLEIPPGHTREKLFEYLSTYYIKEDGPSEGGRIYLNEAFERLLYTIMLVPRQEGRLLEIGANPYFMTLLLKRFRQYDLTLVNYFGAAHPRSSSQTLVFPDGHEERLPFDNINLEAEQLPYGDHSFDVVLLCEVIEHLTNDPLKAVLELKRLLKRGGLLVVTTPNVARLENVSRLMAGQNIYDPYSGHGPYGRHNREYTLGELSELLGHAGFEIETAFTSDVHVNPADDYFSTSGFAHLLAARQDTLGQYIFVGARNTARDKKGKPRWLYRSYPELELS
jgi:SAM-dependent methyltransferase